MTFTLNFKQLTARNYFRNGTVIGKDSPQCLSTHSLFLPTCSGNAADGGATRTSKNAITNSLTLAPNPTTQLVTMQFQSEVATGEITIYDLLGKLHATHNISETKGSWTFDTGPLAAGIYLVVFKNNSGYQSQHKLVKQ